MTKAFREEMDRQSFLPPARRDPGPTMEQLRLRRKAELDPSYVTRLWMRNFPRHLYRYMSFESTNPNSLRNLRSILVSSNLWLTSPRDFNDPFDMKCTVVADADKAAVRRGLEKLLRHVKRRGNLTKADIQQRVSRAMLDLVKVLPPDMLDNRRGEHGVTCFTPHPKNLLMWAHYAQSHRGICLQFRTSFDPGIFATAQEVDYSDEYPIIHWPSFPPGDLKAALLRKGSVWAYENERRILISGLTHRLLGFSPRSLTGIILGCRFPDSEREGLEKILTERELAGHPPVRVLKATMQGSRYGLRCIGERRPL